MDSPTWGDLAKSQVDNETIEEAAARLILAHEADANAHLETGESLQSHKASEIIDHAARSIYQDKMAYDRFTIREHFNSLDGWAKSAHVQVVDYGTAEIYSTGVADVPQYLYALQNSETSEGGCTLSHPYWQLTLAVITNNSLVAYIGQFDDESDSRRPCGRYPVRNSG